MKHILILLATLALLAPARAEEGEVKPKAGEDATNYKAVILRSVPGPVLNEKGFTTGTVKLNKGESYPVVDQNLTEVTILVKGSNVRVAKSDVLISEDTEGGNFVRIISAKYGFPGETQWEVKEEIKKRMPENPLKEAAEILVSDKLLRAKANSMVKTTLVNGRPVVVPRDGAILTITYEVDGDRKVKEVVEGTYLTLP